MVGPRRRGPEVTLLNQAALIFARKVIVDIEVEDLDDVLLIGFAGVVVIQAVVNRWLSRTGGALWAVLKRVAGLEEVALHVVHGVIGYAVHGPILTILGSQAFCLATVHVDNIVVVNFDDVVEVEGTKAGTEWAVGIGLTQRRRREKGKGENEGRSCGHFEVTIASLRIPMLIFYLFPQEKVPM